MERQTPTHVVSDQNLHYLHRSMGISFLNNINDKNIIKQDITQLANRHPVNEDRLVHFT